jgi:predicted nucleic acid-binding protein
MELYAKPDLSDEERKNIDHFLSGATVLPLDSVVEPLAIDIRRFGKPRPKLPDAIVAATAVVLDSPLVSQDDKMLKLTYPGLRVEQFG